MLLLILLLLLLLLLLLYLDYQKEGKKEKINIPLMTFTASSNILLDNGNSLTTSSLDEDSKKVFTCN